MLFTVLITWAVPGSQEICLIINIHQDSVMDLETSRGLFGDDDVATQLMIEQSLLQRHKQSQIKSSVSGDARRSETRPAVGQFRFTDAADIPMKCAAFVSAGSFRSALRERRYSMQ